MSEDLYWRRSDDVCDEGLVELEIVDTRRLVLRDAARHIHHKDDVEDAEAGRGRRGSRGCKQKLSKLQDCTMILKRIKLQDCTMINYS